MKFLDAKKLIEELESDDEVDLRIILSGTLQPLDLFTRAAGAERGLDIQVSAPPFNTLRQALMEPPSDHRSEIALLLPWDFVPSADWRSGLPGHDPDSDVERDIDGLVSLLTASRREALYLPAPIPPVFADVARSRGLESTLLATARSMGARLLDHDKFSLNNYLGHGNPIATRAMGAVGRSLVDVACGPRTGSGKVLVTDFDNTLWAGVVGEDGPKGLAQDPEGMGYPHFLFQTYLKRLKDRGVLIAGVTRNDRDLALAPLSNGDSQIVVEDFVTIIASYEAKSAQIRALAESLNLGLDSFAFVDDNPVELAEVSEALPEVQALQFPSSMEEIPGFFQRLSAFFHRRRVTEEDRRKTELYRTRLAGMPPAKTRGADLRDYLRGLEMVLTIHDRTEGDRTRAVQLINKTNQFNLNGIRVSDEEVAKVLEEGGRLYTATLEDRHGSHGEILCFLVDADGVVRSFVMSCRVFQRKVEHAFLCWMAENGPRVKAVLYQDTERNEPLRRFLADAGLGAWRAQAEEVPSVDLEGFRERQGSVEDLFTLVTGSSVAAP